MNDRASISDDERVKPVLQRAMSINAFCQRYDVGRTKTYDEINQNRLRARKCGKRTIITEGDAEDWLRSLPIYMAAKAGQNQGGRSCA